MAFKRKQNYKSDNFVDDDAEDSRPAKKGKAGGSDFKPSLTAQTDDDGNKYWELSKARRVAVSKFKGNTMINIREYYQADGKSLPGKKGISMTIDQYSALIGVMPQIEKLLREKGEKVPRPDFNGSAQVAEDDEDEQDEQGEHKKANIEATSDEEE